MTTQDAMPVLAPTVAPVLPAWTLRTSFGLAVAAQVLLFAGSNLPTPLFPLYEQHYGFGSGTVTLLFGVYVAALIPALLLLGPVADRIGRRPLLVAGIAVTVLSSVAFAAARNVTWLFAGEIIYGFGSALVMSCLAAAIRELHPAQHVPSASLAMSVAAAVGLTLGPLVSGVLASITPWPTTAPFVLDIILASFLAAALTRIPETRPVTAAPHARTPIIHVPTDIRPAFIAPAIAGAASFMVIGWVMGLSPSFLHEVLGIQITQPVVAGLFAALVLCANGMTQVALRHRVSPNAMHVALVAVVVGMAIMAASGFVGSLAVAIVGAVVAGAGSGVVQMNAMVSVQRIAPVHARGSVTAAYFTICYIAIAVPVFVAGEVAEHLGLQTVTTGYFVALALVVGGALLLSRRAVLRSAS